VAALSCPSAEAATVLMAMALQKDRRDIPFSKVFLSVTRK
jgi:hypothetical protein